MDTQEITEIQRSSYIKLVNETDNSPFDKDETSGEITFPEQKIGSLGIGRLMLHQQYENPLEPDQIVLILDENGIRESSYLEAEKRGLFALSMAIKSPGDKKQEGVTVGLSLDGKTDLVSGIMDPSQFGTEAGQFKSILHEPIDWIVPQIDTSREPLRAPFIMVPNDTKFLSGLGFRFEQTQGGDN